MNCLHLLCSTTLLVLLLLHVEKVSCETLLKSLKNGNLQCYFNDTEQYEYFSTKTSYFNVNNNDTSEIKIPGKYSILL